MTETMLANGQLPESLCSRLIGAGALGTISTDLWGNVVHWSSEAEAMFGWSRDSAVGRHLDELLAPVLPGDAGRSEGAGSADPEPTTREWQKPRATWIFEILARGASWSGTLAKSRLDGTGHRASWPPRPLRAPRVRSSATSCLYRNRESVPTVRAEQPAWAGREVRPPKRQRTASAEPEVQTASSDALHQTQDTFRRVFSESPVGTALVGIDGLIMDVNSSLCRSLGLAPDELIGKNFVEFTHPDDRELEVDYAQRLFDGKIDRFQIDRRFTRADGSMMTGRITASAVRDTGRACPVRDRGRRGRHRTTPLRAGSSRERDGVQANDRSVERRVRRHGRIGPGHGLECRSRAPVRLVAATRRSACRS